MSIKKNNVKRANKLSANAVNLFKVAHDGIVNANELLTEQLTNDIDLITQLKRAVENHNEALDQNAKLIANLKQFIPA